MILRGLRKRTTTEQDVFVLSGLAVVSFPIATLAPLQAWIPPVFAGFIILYRHLKNVKSLLAKQTTITYLFGLTIAWSCIASSWSISVYNSLFSTARLGMIFFLLAILLQVARELPKQGRETVKSWLVKGGLVGTYIALAKGTVLILFTWQDTAYLASYDYKSVKLLFQSSSLVGGFNETAVIIALLCFPIVTCIKESYSARSALIYIVPISLLLVLLAPLAIIVAVIAGMIVFWITQYSRYYSALLVKLSICTYLIFIIFLHNISDWLTRVFLSGVHLPDEALHRLSIWKFAAEKISERPFQGYGLNTSRVFPGAQLETTLYQDASGKLVTAPSMPLHPHSAFLQIWLELGGLGVILTIGLLYIVISGISKIPNARGAAAAMALFTAGFTITQLSFGIWQGWLMGALCTAVILAQILIDPASPYQPANDDL